MTLPESLAVAKCRGRGNAIRADLPTDGVTDGAARTASSMRSARSRTSPELTFVEVGSATPSRATPTPLGLAIQICSVAVARPPHPLESSESTASSIRALRGG